MTLGCQEGQQESDRGVVNVLTSATAISHGASFMTPEISTDNPSPQELPRSSPEARRPSSRD